MGFSGDVSFSGIFSNCSRMDFMDPDIISFFRGNDFNVFNVEGPLTSSPKIDKEGISLLSHTSHITVFKKFHGVIFNLANNHIMDAGVSGLEETLSLASMEDIKAFGSGLNLEEASRPIILEKEKVKVAMIAVCHREGPIAEDNSPGIFCETQQDAIRDVIKDCRRKHDWVVLNYHGGEEFTFVPMPSRRKKFIKYLDYGVDIIVAHHPHVVQGYEEIGEKTIFYSLGNFIFDIPDHLAFEGTNESVSLRILFEKENFSFEPLFTKIDRKTGNVKTLSDNYRFFEIKSNQYNSLWSEECKRVMRKQFQNSMERKLINNNRKLAFLNNLPSKLQKPLRYLKFFYFASLGIKNPYQRAFVIGGLKNFRSHSKKKECSNSKGNSKT